MNFKPLGKRLVVEPIRPDMSFAGGKLVLPETASKRPVQGIIRTKADRVERFEIGQRVLFSAHAGTEIKYGKTTMYVMEERHILAVIEEDENE